jgi:hypothetical protein
MKSKDEILGPESGADSNDSPGLQIFDSEAHHDDQELEASRALNETEDGLEQISKVVLDEAVEGWFIDHEMLVGHVREVCKALYRENGRLAVREQQLQLELARLDKLVEQQRVDAQRTSEGVKLALTTKLDDLTQQHLKVQDAYNTVQAQLQAAQTKLENEGVVSKVVVAVVIVVPCEPQKDCNCSFKFNVFRKNAWKTLN